MSELDEKQIMQVMYRLYDIPRCNFDVLSSSEQRYYDFLVVLSESNIVTAAKAFPRFFNRLVSFANRYKEE